MTTAYLAQKLMKVKLDKAEVDKVRHLRKCTLEAKRALRVSLKKIIIQQQSRKTCRLCLQPGDKEICSAYSKASCIARDVKYVTGIEVMKNDGKPQHICNTCLENLQTAVIFKKTAEMSQWRLQKELEIVNEQDVEDLDTPTPEKHHNCYFVVKGTQIVREWKCKECKSTFQNEAELTGHVRLRSCGYMCEVCGKELKTLARLNRHRLSHEKGDRLHKCRYCTFSAHTRYELRVHERWHTGDRPLKCNVCSSIFTCNSTLWHHQKKHEPPKFHCRLCPRSFRYKELLRDHIASFHSKVKAHLCNFCEKAFSTRRKMLLHERRVHHRPKMRAVMKLNSSNIV